MKLPRNCKVIDLGCSDGYGLQLLGEMGWDGYGADRKAKFLERTREICKGVFVWDIVEPPPFPDKFPLVLALNILEYIKEVDKAICHAYEVMEEGGVFLCTAANRYSFLNNPPPYPKSAREWKQHFLAQGFQRVKVQGFFSIPPLRRFLGLRPFPVPVVGSHIRILATKG